MGTVKFLDLYSQYESIRDEVDAAIKNVISETAFVGGKHVAAFEEAFAAYIGVDHCVGVGNGTDALEIALEALDLPEGSGVVVPANSFIATSEAVTRSGMRVVFCDIDPETYTLSMDDLAGKLDDNIKAVMAVHLYGHACDMDRLNDLKARWGFKVIEDCAQAHGATYKGRKVGSFGEAATFSFYPGKNLGAYGDGGAVLTGDIDLAERCRMIANHGRMTKFDHCLEGRNSRLDGLQAAILSVKLNHLDAWTARRREAGAAYKKLLEGVPGVTLPVTADWADHVFHLFVIRSAKRDLLREHLTAADIQTGLHYPIALPCLKAYEYLNQAEANPVAVKQAGELLSLPMGEHLTAGDLERTAAAVREFSGGH